MPLSKKSRALCMLTRSRKRKEQNNIHREVMDRKHPFYTFQKIFRLIFEEIFAYKNNISQACNGSSRVILRNIDSSSF